MRLRIASDSYRVGVALELLSPVGHSVSCSPVIMIARSGAERMMFPLLLLAVSGAVWVVQGSDLNWGKKVNCFVVDETVICPGCNYRAGLSCPRTLKNSQNCLVSTTELAPPRYRTKPPPDTTYEEENSTEVPLVIGGNFTTQNPNEVQKEPTKTPIDMAIFLYRLLGPWPPSKRYRRGVKQMQNEELEICNWNGDCPCPLICCKTGPGCPKRCVMGVRLPPPFG